jgi:hypothetical protein
MKDLKVIISDSRAWYLQQILQQSADRTQELITKLLINIGTANTASN